MPWTGENTPCRNPGAGDPWSKESKSGYFDHDVESVFFCLQTKTPSLFTWQGGLPPMSGNVVILPHVMGKCTLNWIEVKQILCYSIKPLTIKCSGLC